MVFRANYNVEHLKNHLAIPPHPLRPSNSWARADRRFKVHGWPSGYIGQRRRVFQKLLKLLKFRSKSSEMLGAPQSFWTCDHHLCAGFWSWTTCPMIFLQIFSRSLFQAKNSGNPLFCSGAIIFSICGLLCTLHRGQDLLLAVFLASLSTGISMMQRT
jgi:hypothetical protein